MNDIDIIIAIILTTLIIIILISVVIISIFIAHRQRNKQQIELAYTKLNYEKELRQVEVEVSEQMMEKFAQELHDNIGHILTLMRLQIENKKLDEPSLETHFQPVEQHLNEATTELRALSRSLNTDYVSNIGLRAAINIEVERVQRLKRMSLVYDTDKDSLELDKNQQLMVFRIFQEMVHNSLRHSKATNLYISLKTAEGFELLVRDDGHGFDYNHILQSVHASGLKNMIKRARLAGLHCNINSAPGKGCTYLLKKEKNISDN